MNQTGSDENDLFQRKRAALGLCALLCFLLALVLYLVGAEKGVVLAGAIRIGIVLGTTWLALPQLRGMLAKLPSMIPIAALLLIAVCAPNPNLFRILATLIAVGGGLLAISKWIKSVSSQRS